MMSLFIASIASGSNGNCYYVGNSEEAVLIDAGISCKEIEKRLGRLNLSPKKIKAVFITHEHSDHIKGVEVFARKHKLPVYITPATYLNSRLRIEDEFRKDFRAYIPVTIGNLEIIPFPKLHDASDPHSFIVSGGGTNIGVLTDIGFACDHVIRQFKQCHAVFLESNYDEEMLESGGYPYYLKRRIQSDTGHLSNAQALELFNNHRPTHMSHVFLSHLSRDNNSPQLVVNLFNEHASGTKIVLASRDYETEVYHINGSLVEESVISGTFIGATKAQMTLF